VRAKQAVSSQLDHALLMNANIDPEQGAQRKFGLMFVAT